MGSSILCTRDSLVSIEVKASRGKSQSMRTFIESDKNGDITCGITLTAGNVVFAN